MGTKVIAPFKAYMEERYTMVDNDFIDYVWPMLKPNTAKLLLAVLRETTGRLDDKHRDGRRKIMAKLSYSLLRKKTGIASNDTLSRAIKDAVECGYLVQIVNNGISYFQINIDLKIEVDDGFVDDTEALQNLSQERYSFGNGSVTDSVNIKRNKERKKDSEANASGDSSSLLLSSGQPDTTEQEVDDFDFDMNPPELATENKPAPAPSAGKPSSRKKTADDPEVREAKEALSQAFETATHLTPRMVGFGKWREGIKKLYENGITPDLVTRAVLTMKEKKLSISWPGSVFTVAWNLLEEDKTQKTSIVKNQTYTPANVGGGLYL